MTGYNRIPKAYKVHKEHVEFLLQEIKKNKTITIDDLLHLLKNKYLTLDLNKSHIHIIIHDNNITLKMTRIRHEPIKRFGKDIDIIYIIFFYILKIIMVNGNNLDLILNTICMSVGGLVLVEKLVH